MNKAKNIVLLVGAIIAFVSIFGLLISSIIMFIFGSPLCFDIMVEGVKNGSVHVSGYDGTPEEIAKFAQMLLIIVGAVLLVLILPYIAGGIVGLIARKRESTALNVAVLVLGIISANYVLAAGGVIGLVKQEQEK